MLWTILLTTISGCSSWRARPTSTILSLGCRPALSAGEFSSTALMYCPGRARSLCRLKPYPLDPRWITQRRGLSSGHTSWTKTGNKGNRQAGALLRAARWAKTAPFFTENTSTMGVCSERTSGTKIMESSSESLTMNMKPRPNMQVAAACWRVERRFNGAKSEAAAQLHVTPNCFPGRKRVSEACDWRSVGGKNRGETGGGSSGGRSWFRWGRRPLPAPGSEEDNGSWALTPCMPQSSPSPIQSHFGMAGRVGAVLSSRKRLELKLRASLPLYGWGGYFI